MYVTNICLSLLLLSHACFSESGANSTTTDSSSSTSTSDEDSLCPAFREEAAARGRQCLRKCKTDADCISSRKRCLCDGQCGWSCVRPGKQFNEKIWNVSWLSLAWRPRRKIQIHFTDSNFAPLMPALRFVVTQYFIFSSFPLLLTFPYRQLFCLSTSPLLMQSVYACVWKK